MSASGVSRVCLSVSVWAAAEGQLFASTADGRQSPSCGHLAPPYDNAMNDSRYRSGRTAGDKWGCGLAAIVACPLFFFLVLVQALGDCVPDLPCHKSFWLMVVS